MAKFMVEFFYDNMFLTINAYTVKNKWKSRREIHGYVIDQNEDGLPNVKILLEGTKTKIKKKTVSEEDGYFDFGSLKPDLYKLTATKNNKSRVKYIYFKNNAIYHFYFNFN
jgi:hypothetical protein